MPSAAVRRSHRPLFVATCVLASLLPQGCVTTEQVEALLDESNRSIVALVETSQDSLDTLIANADRDTIAQVSGDVGLLPEGSGSADDSWLESVERIDRFIADNPQAQVVNNTLRVRQASTLMMAKQLNLAAAVFDEVDPDIELSQRDRAIYDAREALLFWYGLASTLGPGQGEAIRGHLDTLAAVADGLDRELAARRYLEQVRVRMALRLARSIARAEPLAAALSEPMDRYGATFDGVREVVLSWHGDTLGGDVAVQQLANLRWYDYVPCAFTRADSLLREACTGRTDGVCGGAFTPDWLAGLDSPACTD